MDGSGILLIRGILKEQKVSGKDQDMLLVSSSGKGLWTGDINLGVAEIQVVFKALRAGNTM